MHLNKKVKRGLNKAYKESLQLIYQDSVDPPVLAHNIEGLHSASEINNDNHSTISETSESVVSLISEVSVLSSVFEKTNLTNAASESANFKESLKNWSLKHNITHSATNDLLKLLQGHSCFTNIPSDSRSLLSTPRYSTVKDVTPGQYINFNWRPHIEKYLQPAKNQVAQIQINIDGINIFSGSNKSLWPILGHIKNTKDVFCMGIYLGPTKPNKVNDYISDFVQDFLNIQKEIGNYLLEIDCIICDAPARSFISGIKNHTGYFGCGKCVTKGSYIENRVTFPEVNAELRTDVSFRNKIHLSHHTEDTDIKKLPIDLVRDIPFEYMHLICLGVTRKLLYLWCTIKKSQTRLKPHEIQSINDRLLVVKKFTPCEFSRRPRSLKELDYWKATELRQFLLYTGPVVLKHIISPQLYEHFLCLSVAVRLLLSELTYKKYNAYADELLVYFVQCFQTLYGAKNLSYNVHGLIHLAKDSYCHGPLDNFSGFKFENHLQKIKYLVRSPFNALQQVYNRVVELESSSSISSSSTPHNCLLKEIHSVNHLDETHFSIYKTNSFVFKLSQGNNCVQLNCGQIGTIIKFIKKKDNGEYILFRQFKFQSDFFTAPCRSSFVGIYLVSCLKKPEIRNIQEISTKVYLIPFSAEFVAVKLVHRD